MNFGVIGEPCIDFIQKPGYASADTEKRKYLGGIIYSVVSLAAISQNDGYSPEDGHRIYPIMYLGFDEYENIISFLSGFKNIKPDFIIKSEQKIRVVNLQYRTPDAAEREEIWTEPMPPVDFSYIEKALPGLDALLINMISGVDINLETLGKIKKNFANYTHIDIHNIVIKREKDGRTIRQAPDFWEKWCTCCDSIQMNEPEISVLTGHPASVSTEYETADKILSAGEGPGTKVMVLTRGKTGASLFQKKEKKVMNEKYFEIDRTDVPAAERSNFSDSTGCGDVFASAFFYKNAVTGTRDYLKAFKFANRIAGMKTELTGADELYKLGEKFSVKGVK